MAFKKKTNLDRLNVNKERKRRVKLFFIFTGAFLAIMLYLGLLAGTAMLLYRDNNVLSGVLRTFQDAGKDISVLWTIKISSKTLIAEGVMLLIWALGTALLWYDDVKHRHDLSGIEKGSARLNDDFKGFREKYGDELFNTSLLSQNVALSMNTRKTLRNNNMLIIGGSGAGKSRFFVKPNILQSNCNMVITDPSGELLEATGDFLKNEGYAVKVFNLVEMQKSNCYNPFHYIRNDPGVIMMINCLIKNTTPPESHSNDPFWEKSETALLQALCFYLKDHRPESERNFSTIMELLRWAEVDEKNPDFESKLDRIFLKSKQKQKRSAASLHGAAVNVSSQEDLEFNKYLARTTYKDKHGAIRDNAEFKSLEELDVNGTDIAVKQYKIFKMGAGKTAKSILISCAVRLTAFNIPEVAHLTNTDDIHLEDLGGTNADQRKQALFVIIPAADSTFNFLVSMMYTQLFETLYFVGDTDPQCVKNRLPRHVKFLLDEFANIGTIPEFTKKLATMRKYEISCSVILQNLAQIKTMYKDDWESIVGNCDSLIFLGGKEFTTLEYLSKQLGSQTIEIQHINRQGPSSKSGGSTSRNAQHDKRELLTPDELGNLDNSQCVIQIRGLDPFLDRKYDYVAHPRYQYTSDADSSLSYKNNLNNMAHVEVDVELEAMEIMDTQAKQLNRMCSLEEIIKNNPNWNDYPSIFSKFRTIPATHEADNEIDMAIAAVAVNPPLDDAPTTPSKDPTIRTIEELIYDFKETGVPPSASPVLDTPTNSFFDDLDD